MIGVKEAAGIALEYVAQLYAGDDLKQLRLEEIEPADEGAMWHVTVSWLESALLPGAGGFFGGKSPEPTPRVYKLLKIDADAGNVISLHIRRV